MYIDAGEAKRHGSLGMQTQNGQAERDKKPITPQRRSTLRNVDQSGPTPTSAPVMSQSCYSLLLNFDRSIPTPSG